jgi:peptidoglycan/LPS O-acetylase OafA/YrhL
MPSPNPKPMIRKPAIRSAAAAAALDALCVLVFCAVGRRSHAEGVTINGVAETAWPFLTGAAVGWLVSRGWRRPAAVAPTGVAVWLCTVAIGMLLRKASSQGLVVSFVLVASLVTALLLLGWRAGRRGWLTLRRRRAASTP